MRLARVACLGAVHDATDGGASLRLADGTLVAEDAVVWLPPLTPTERARTIVAAGANYAEQSRELAFKAPDEPDVHVKAGNVLVGHRGQARRPVDATYMCCACQLAVVIGRTARRVTRADAYDYVAGYSVANEYVVRDYVEYRRLPTLRGRGRDGSTALGPWLVDAADVRDPMNLRMRTWVNDTIVKEDSTRDMIFDIRFLIAYLTDFMTLSRGDVILTGASARPAGVHEGDQVVTEIDGIGRLLSVVVGDPRGEEAAA